MPYHETPSLLPPTSFFFPPYSILSFPTSLAPLTADDIEMTKVPPPDTDSTHFSEFMSTPYGKQVSVCV